LDRGTCAYYNSVKHKLTNSDKVIVEVFEETDDIWQNYKIKIFEDYYQQDDYVILDADSIWENMPTIPNDKIMFLNSTGTLTNSTVSNIKLVQELHDKIDMDMIHYQIGFLSIPMKFHSNGLIEEWYGLTDGISNFKKLPEINRTCEQLSISLLSQMQFPNDITVLEDNPYKMHQKKDYLESLYFGCRPPEWDILLRMNGWSE